MFRRIYTFVTNYNFQFLMSALEIPKQVIPFNNNSSNVTTTKGIARALTNSTSPQSDCENRPILNPSALKSGHVSSAVSPGAHFKQSTLMFNNNKKSPHAGALKGADPKSFPDIASSSSDSSPYSSDDEVLLVTNSKKEEPLSKFIDQMGKQGD